VQVALIIGLALGLLGFFAAGILTGYFLAKRGYDSRILELNTADDCREQGARLLMESLMAKKLIDEQTLRTRAFEHFRLAETIEATQPIPTQKG
jgi:hypothetical protein